ncbi:MAG: energy-coupling factor transporter ATPase [Firmicutes bacterium]|nr:energy-coupling factor transporter ATPase [Bacillota bacterium]
MDFVKSEHLVYDYKTYNENSEIVTNRAINGLDIAIPKGQFIAVLGHNGSGKSTFAKQINALLLPSDGKMTVNGLDTADEKNTWSIRQSAGMVFQNPDNQIIATIIEEEIAFGPENLGIPSAEIKTRVEDALLSVNMSKYRNSSPMMLSGGQKQRIAIAGVLAMRPDCIVLDEPTAMLDPIGRRQVINTLLQLNKQGITIVLITHYMEEACLADRVAVFDKGSLVMDGTPAEIFRQVERVKQLHLDVPQVTELASKLIKRGVSLPNDILTIDDMAAALLEKGFKKDVSFPRDEREYKIPQTLIEVKNLTHIYGKETVYESVALKNVSLKIGKGELIGLIGHTGSGKSTLIQHLNALSKPDEGCVMLDGFDINSDKSRLKEVRRRVGLVFQYPEHQLFETTVFKDVAFGPENLGLSAEEIQTRVKDALASVGMGEEYYEKSPFELSGGQKRRVAIAGVLAMHPEVLVLDEPTAGLDPYSRDEILANIKRMHKELDMTVILVSHSMEDISRIADRILVMNKGCVEFFDTPQKVFGHIKRLTEIGLNAPQISLLMDRLNDEGTALPRSIFDVDTACEVLYNALAGVSA